MINLPIKISSFVLLISLLAGTTTVAARSLQITEDFLHSGNPLYIRISAGNHQGCPSAGDCQSVNYRLLLSTAAGEMTLAKELLIGSDETLDNPLHDTGLPASMLEMQFRTEFFKGAIVKLYPDQDATLEDLFSIEMEMDGEDAYSVDIPFRLLSPDSLSILYTAINVDPELAGWREQADNLQVQVLFTGLEDAETAHNFRNKLEVVKRLLALERVARNSLLAGEITNLTYTELQGLWAIVWNNLLFSDNDLLLFTQRYQRIKTRYNNSLTSLPLLIGNLKVLLQNIRYRAQLEK